jgi:hypothetical protein
MAKLNFKINKNWGDCRKFEDILGIVRWEAPEYINNWHFYNYKCEIFRYILHQSIIIYIIIILIILIKS